MTHLLDRLTQPITAVPILGLVVMWCWETWRPFFGRRPGRLRHAARNLALTLVNTVVIATLFATATVSLANWTTDRSLGLLNIIALPPAVQFVGALALLDAWMYLWHRANHLVPLLWRFHRMHHSDRQMDVTTATRFHLGELTAASTLRLSLIPILGLQSIHILTYEACLLLATQFHHADISIGRCDRWLRLLIVTPDMHKVHHSDYQPETDSNFSTILSLWDRLGRSFRLRTDPKSIVFGVRELAGPSWENWWGLWKTPFKKASASTQASPDDDKVNSP